jgi:hypothetical protein
LDAVWTSDRAALAIGAAHCGDIGPEFEEFLAAQGKLAVTLSASRSITDASEVVMQPNANVVTFKPLLPNLR